MTLTKTGSSQPRPRVDPADDHVWDQLRRVLDQEA